MEYLPLGSIRPPLKLGDKVVNREYKNLVYTVVMEKGRLVARAGDSNFQTVETSNLYNWARVSSEPFNLDNYM